MWLVAMFDLPVSTRDEKRVSARFRKSLLSRGFCMLQFSVYARFCSCEEFAEGIMAELKSVLPSRGQVRLVLITDRQFGKMQVFDGQNRAKAEAPQPQLMLF